MRAENRYPLFLIPLQLHGPDALYKEILRAVDRAAQCLKANDDIGAQHELDALGLTELSLDGEAMMRAVADDLGIKALDLPLRASMRTWNARDIARLLPIFKKHRDAARSLAKGFVIFNPWDAEDHPRWPAGAPASQGGEFAPAGESEAVVVPVADRESRAKPSVAANPGVPVVLPDGSKISDENSPTGYMMSPVADLSPVAAAGRKVGAQFQDLAADPEGGGGAWTYLGLELGLSLGRAGLFDYQREGSFLTGYTPFSQWINVSNFNVGLFCQQAGLSLDQTTTIAGTFSTATFASNRNKEQPYSPNSDQYKYVLMGYRAGKSGMFGEPAEQH
jgi:hypothetical protein